MNQDTVDRAMQQMSVFDRRIGQLGAFRGFIEPDQINAILLDQTRNGGVFGECAVRMNLMSTKHIDHLLKLQNEEVFLFAQAVMALKLTTAEKIADHIKSFITAFPEVAKESAPTVSQEKRELDKHVQEVLKSVDSVSPLPTTVQRVMSMLNDPKVDLDKVGDALSADPGLSSTLLRVANSAMYGLRERVTSVRKAVTVMGIQKLRQMLLSSGVMEKFKSVPADFAQKFWEDALWTAQWSKELAAYRRMEEVDEIFVFGLLRNIGRLLIYQHFRPMLAKIDEQVKAGKTRLDAERAVLGGTHADLAGFLFNLWQMPKKMVESTMMQHHDLQLLLRMPNIPDEVLVVHMAVAIRETDPNLDSIAYQDELARIGNLYRDPLKLGAGFKMQGLAEKVETNIGQILATFKSA